MDELTAIIERYTVAQTTEEISAVEEELEAYGMSLPFVNALFQIISSNLSLRKFASMYLGVKCSHSFDKIPEDSAAFILENFPSLLFSVSNDLYDYYEKIAYYLCFFGYVHSVTSSPILSNFLSFFGEAHQMRGASILLSQLCEAATQINSDQILDSTSFFILTNALQNIAEVIFGVDDLFVKGNLLNALAILFKDCSKTHQQQETPDLSEEIQKTCQIFENLVNFFGNIDDPCYIQFLCKAIALWSTLVSNYEFENEEFALSITNSIFEVVFSFKQSNSAVLIEFFLFIQCGFKMSSLNQYKNEHFPAILEELIFPLYVLSDETIALSATDPVSFVVNSNANTQYLSHSHMDVLSASATCMIIIDIKDLNQIIINFITHGVELFSQNQNPAELYSYFHFCSIKLKNVLVGNDEVIDFIVSCSELLSNENELARCAYLLLISSIDATKPPVYPVDLTIACVEQMGVESDLVRYYACTAVRVQMESIVRSPEAIDLFTEKFEFNVTEFIETIFALSHAFGDPNLMGTITCCIKIPAFKSSIIELAPDIVAQHFDFASSLIDDRNEEGKNETGVYFVFNGLMNLLDIVKTNPEVLASIATIIAQQIVEHSSFFDTILRPSLVDLAALTIGYCPNGLEELWDLAKAVFGIIQTDSDTDVCDHICLIIYNIAVVDIPLARQHIEWILEIVDIPDGLFRKSILYCTCLLILSENEEEIKEQILRMAFDLTLDIVQSDVACYDYEDSAHLFYILFTRFPNESLEAYGEETLTFLDNFMSYASTDLDLLEMFCALYNFLDEESRAKFMFSLIHFVKPDKLLDENLQFDFEKENILVHLSPQYPESAQERETKTIGFLREIMAQNPTEANRTGLTEFFYKYDNHIANPYDASDISEE